MRFSLTWIHGAALASVVLAAVGCSSDQTPAAAATLSPLELPIFDCQTTQASCLANAKSPTDAGSCNDAFKQCLTDAAPKLLELAKTVADCQSKARECVTSGGRQAVPSCRKDFLTCVGVDLPDASVAADASAPNPPPHDGPGLPDGGPLPPRDPGKGFAGGPGVPPGPGTPPGLPPNAPPGPPQGFAGAPGLPPGFAGAPAFPPFAGAPGASGLPGFAGGPAAPEPPIGGPGPVMEPPGFGCVDDLRKCIEDGKEPSECATLGRECLKQQVPDARMPNDPSDHGR